MRVSISTLGCPKNVVDSERLVRSLLSRGVPVVDDPRAADILVVNTCGFIRDAKEESIGEVLRLAEIKNSSGAKRLVVIGCLAERYREELIKEIPEIDVIWGVGKEGEVVEYCEQLAKGRGQESRDGEGAARGTLNSSYAYLKIAEGCDKRCTFCVIPSIRGRFRSFKPDVILSEAEQHIKNGIREIILIAQDITSYGKGLKGYNLLSLLRDLTSLSGEFYIRLLYLYPTGIKDELIGFIATNDRILKYLDIPLQHSEDRILRLMGRSGTKRAYRDLLRRLRQDIPDIALRTTFIVGFPTETEEEFKHLIDFIEEIGFDRLGVFKYSREEGTYAGRLKGHIPEKVKQRRYDEIMRRQALISLTKNRELIGRRFRAIIDGVDRGVAIARLYSHAPEVDGVVVIEDKQRAIKTGDLVDVEIVEADVYDLKAVLVDPSP
jgi:ribosomal protein S12 methylthiotransferase